MFPKTSLRSLPDHLKWRCETIDPGTAVKGVLAGLPIPVRTHWDGKATKPCLADISCRALHCRCTVTPMQSVITIYTPIISSDLERLVVPASERVGEKLMEFTPGKYLALARPNKRCAGLNIIIPTEPDGGHAWVKRLRPTCVHDISEYLLHLWQIPALNKHFGVPFRPAVGTVMVYDDQTGAVTVKE